MNAPLTSRGEFDHEEELWRCPGQWCVPGVGWVVWATLPPTQASAQERKGFWIGGGPLLSADTRGGTGINVDGFIDLGWTIRLWVLVGLELGGFGGTAWNSESDARPTQWFTLELPVAATLYPRSNAGFFVRAGAGPSLLRNENDAGGLRVHGNGVVIMVGGGYDHYLGKNAALTFGAHYWYDRVGHVDIAGSTGGPRLSRRQLVMSVGIKMN